MINSTKVDRQAVAAKLAEAITEHNIDMMLMRNPSGCFAYITLWDDGDVTSGIEASRCHSAAPRETWLQVVAKNTPHDSYAVGDMPFGVERDDDSVGLFLVNKDLHELGWATEVDGVEGYITSYDKHQIEENNAKVLMGLDWDANDYCGDEPLCDGDLVEQIVGAFFDGDREKASRLSDDI